MMRSRSSGRSRRFSGALAGNTSLPAWGSTLQSLKPAAALHGEDPLAFVRNQELFGPLAGEPRFVEAYQAALAVLHRSGAKAMIELLT